MPGVTSEMLDWWFPWHSVGSDLRYKIWDPEDHYFALLFSFVRSRTNQASDTIIGVFSSTAVALGIFIATMGGSSFSKFN